MKFAIVICSAGRADVLDATLQGIFAQSVKPGQVVIAVTQSGDVTNSTRCDGRIQVVLSPKGSSIQRNRAVDLVSEDCDLVCFLDDDVELDRHYFEHLLNVFADEAVVLATGTIIADGNHVPITREAARQLLATHTEPGRSPGEPEIVPDAYGCNMCVRRALLNTISFDERLALYGWLEDADFSRRCANMGTVVRSPRATLVHLGSPAGRVSGLQLGFSQVMNPLYLVHKGTFPSVSYIFVRHWLKVVLANAIYSVVGDKYADRRGRLRGNLIAFRMIMAGHVEPEHVAHLR